MIPASPLQVLRGLAVAALALAWAIAAHVGSTGAGSPDLNAAIGVAPLVLAALMLPVCRAGLARWLCLAVLAGGLYLLWPLLRQNVALLYLLQHAGINLALASLFGRSLSGPGEPLVTRLARLVFPDGISERKVRYTRGVTIAWTVFFVANASLSLGLYVFASPAVWSVYANLLGLPLLGAMFLGEHLLRLRMLSAEERPGIAEIVRAWRRHSAQRSAPPQSPVSGA